MGLEALVVSQPSQELVERREREREGGAGHISEKGHEEGIRVFFNFRPYYTINKYSY